MEGWYTNASFDGLVNEFLSSSRAKLQATSGFSDLSVYVDYAHGDEGPRGWYSSRKLDRLSTLKEQWDPQGLFSWNNPITGSVGCHKSF
jgi:fumiquinazoline A oxidase